MKRSTAALAIFVCLVGSVNAMGSGSKPITFYDTNPTYQDKVNDDKTWKLATPESVGLSSPRLESGAKALAAKRSSFSLLVVRNGSLVFERYFHGSTKRSSNNVHSASKSILSAAVGIAISKGQMKGTTQYLSELLSGAPRDVQLRHLLTMSAGIRWTEDSTEYQIEKEKNWVQAILRLPFPEAPGRKFLYSTGLTHLMSAALTKATGMSTAEYVRRNIFQKIGIADERWGSDPQGISSGGYNVYLTPREMAKFGMLYLNGGKWNGQQVVPEAWVNDSLSVKINARTGFDYGYNWWLRNLNGYEVKFAWGYGGQYIYVVPQLNMVVVMSTNTRSYSDEIDGDAVMQAHLLPAAMAH